MKAAIVTASGQVPAYGDFASPEPTEDSVRVTVTAAALSHATRSRAAGSAGRGAFVPGIDGVGRLDDGRRVYFFMPRAPYGAMGEQTLVGSRQIVPLPDDLDDVTAAAIANPGVSSWAAFTDRARLRPGEIVLVNGATGASDRLAVRIAKHMGAGKVIATGRNPRSLEDLPALGADVVIPLGDAAALEERLKEQFAQGIDVVADYLWGQPALAVMAAAARSETQGRPIRFVAIGSVTGPELMLPGVVLRATAIEIMGSGLGSMSADRLMANLRSVIENVAAAGLSVAAKTVPLSDVSTAWNAPDDGRRTVFIPAGGA